MNGRQQRAQDQESSTSSSSSSLDSDNLQDLQFRAEMEQYDAFIEEAHVIAEKERQRQQEQGQESDSELSALASSLFNGIEGTETGSAKLGGQGNDKEEVGSRVGGGVTIQGLRISPRRTLSEKIVKYKDE